MENLTVNKNGNLTVGKVDLVSLAKDFGTPLIVMDETEIRYECREFRDSIAKYYDGNGIAAYASKALCCIHMCKIAESEGLGLDLSSVGEIHTALRAGFNPQKIYFHGNYKSDADFEYALDARVGRIEIDNISELERLNNLAKRKKLVAEVMLRVKPGVDAHTHDFIKTGKIDSKFGFTLENGEAFDAVKRVLDCKHISLKCVNCHIGSQIFEIEPFRHTAEIMLDFIAKIRDELGYGIHELNLGGGFGIRYTDEDDPMEVEDCIRLVTETVKMKCKKLGLEQPFLVFEPGRKIVGDKGLTLYTVGYVKKIPNIRTYVIVDGGMTDNPRYVMYGAKYEATSVTRANEPKNTSVTISGRTCESGDMIGENIPLQDVKDGELIAVLGTGAYNYSMASNYNRMPKPAVIFVNKNRAYVAIRRETNDDIIRNDVNIN